MAAERGPVPKRSDERRRRNKGEQTSTARGKSRVTKPAPDPEWHPIAKRWYQALGKSGQAVYFEHSDWATAQYVAEGMSRSLHDRKSGMNGQLFSAVISASGNLLVTEGDRRRLRVELEQPQEQDPDEAKADATVIELRKMLGG